MRLLVTNAIGFVQTRGAAMVRIIAPVLAFFSALDFGNEWSTYLLARHAQTFGVKDPTYGLDLGFFVFTLPWLRAISNYACALLLLTTLSTIGIYAALQAMAALAKIELGRPRVRAHVHVLIGVTIFAFAVQMFLKTYEAGLVDSGQFTGAGYAAMQGIAVQRFLAILALAVGAGTVANGWFGRPFSMVSGGIGTIAVCYVLGVLAWPTLVQKVYVDPDRIPKESPYAEKAIAMTRFGYGLDKIQVRDEVPELRTDPGGSRSLAEHVRQHAPLEPGSSFGSGSWRGTRRSGPTTGSMTWTSDRYMVGGKKTLLMLSPRQLDLGGLQPNARNWANERLQYTHGYGVVVARVDQETSDGGPVMLDEDVPQRSEPDLAVKEPRLYYGLPHSKSDTNEPRNRFELPVDEYAIVDTGQAELDYPTSDTAVTTRWTGQGGIPIGGLLTKLMFSMRLGDGNLLVSPEIRSTSRLLMHRDLFERASRIYPFLNFDQDPYIVILGGRLVWMLDGYTTSDMLPYSAYTSDFQRVNYIRNPVKITIDAYTGDTTAYAVDEKEPILNAWREVYPGLIPSRLRDSGRTRRPLPLSGGYAGAFKATKHSASIITSPILEDVAQQQWLVEHRRPKGPSPWGAGTDPAVLCGTDSSRRSWNQLRADPAVHPDRQDQHERMAGRPLRSRSIWPTYAVQPRPVEPDPRSRTDGGFVQYEARDLEHQSAVQ